MITFDFSRLGDLRGRRLLDVGAGAGRHAIEAARRGAIVTCVELSTEAMREIPIAARAAEELLGLEPGGLSMRISVVKADARSLPFPACSFDALIASEVLEHVSEDGEVLAELARVAGPGAKIAVSVPRFFPEVVSWFLSLAYHDAEGGHIRIYTRRLLSERLTSIGLRPLGVGYAHALHTPYWWLKCLAGVDNDSAAPVAAYHKRLVAQMMGEAPELERLEQRLNPWLGKSLAIYAERQAGDLEVRQFAGRR
ncbi:MAG: class I SAM-dependent methyltransferase [Actinomycetota bacterium]|nr:class I SAM-dependent methyltransferase [Actinomycetota bacterium]